MVLFTQILTGSLILLIGFMSFKWDKPEIKIKTHSWLQNNSAEAY